MDVWYAKVNESFQGACWFSPEAGPFHSRILTGFGRARLLPSLFISPRLRTGSAGASPSRENETALSPEGLCLTLMNHLV